MACGVPICWSKYTTREEICLANFTPPANVASLDRYLVKMLLFRPQLWPYQPLFRQFFKKQLFDKYVLKNFSPFCSASPEIKGVKHVNRQTE